MTPTCSCRLCLLHLVSFLSKILPKYQKISISKLFCFGSGCVDCSSRPHQPSTNIKCKVRSWPHFLLTSDAMSHYHNHKLLYLSASLLVLGLNTVLQHTSVAAFILPQIMCNALQTRMAHIISYIEINSQVLMTALSLLLSIQMIKMWQLFKTPMRYFLGVQLSYALYSDNINTNVKSLCDSCCVAQRQLEHNIHQLGLKIRDKVILLYNIIAQYAASPAGGATAADSRSLNGRRGGGVRPELSIRRRTC